MLCLLHPTEESLQYVNFVTTGHSCKKVIDRMCELEFLEKYTPYLEYQRMLPADMAEIKAWSEHPRPAFWPWTIPPYQHPAHPPAPQPVTDDDELPPVDRILTQAAEKVSLPAPTGWPSDSDEE